MKTDITKINFMQTGAKVFSVPTGYSTIREGGNVCIHNDEAIWIGTCDYYDGKRKYSLHYWTCNFKTYPKLDNWAYGGKIKIVGGNGVEIIGEDTDLQFQNGRFTLRFENKSYEDEYQICTVGYAVGGSSIKDTFIFYGGKYGLSPSNEDNYWKTAVYSPHSAEGRDDLMYFGARKMTGKPSTEEPALAKWNGSKWIPLDKPLLYGADYGYQSFDHSSDIWKVGDKYVCIGGGLRGWTPANANIKPEQFYWCNGVMEGDTLESGWKVTKTEIRNEKGEIMLYAFFYIEGIGWKALAQDYAGQNVYISTIVTGDSIPDEPQEEKMLNLKVTKLGDKVLLEWTFPHPTGDNAVHIEDDFGYFLTKDIMAKGKWEFDNVRKSTKFRIRADSVGLYEPWVYLEGVVEPEEPVEPPVIPDEPNDNVEIANQIIELAKKIK